MARKLYPKEYRDQLVELARWPEFVVVVGWASWCLSC